MVTLPECPDNDPFVTQKNHVVSPAAQRKPIIHLPISAKLPAWIQKCHIFQSTERFFDHTF